MVYFPRKILFVPILLGSLLVFYAGLASRDAGILRRGPYFPARRNGTYSHGTSEVRPVETNAYNRTDYNKSNINKSDIERFGLPSKSFNLHRWRILSGRVKPEDLMKSGPFDFLPNYRNPCWKAPTRRGVPIRCLPYFYLLGAPKAGTTDLFYRIVQHPSVTSRVTKEPHWLPRGRLYSTELSQIRPRLTDYVRLFSAAIKDVYRSKNRATGRHEKVFGDGSASTLWDNDYWTLLPGAEGRSEPLYTNADYIHHLNPNTKVIAILRNPIDRLYSDFLFFHKGDKGPLVFHDAALQAMDQMRDCLANGTLRHCVYTRPPPTVPLVRLRIGIYHVFLEEYFRVFPRDQVLVLKLEDYSNHAQDCMRKVFEFLELEPIGQKRLAAISTMNPKNTRRETDKALGGMLPETRALLYNFYYPYNEQLSELLGDQFDYNNEDQQSLVP